MRRKMGMMGRVKGGQLRVLVMFNIFIQTRHSEGVLGRDGEYELTASVPGTYSVSYHLSELSVNSFQSRKSEESDVEAAIAAESARLSVNTPPLKDH